MPPKTILTVAAALLASIAFTSGCDDQPTQPTRTRKVRIEIEGTRPACPPGQPCPAPVPVYHAGIKVRAPYGQPFARLVSFDQLPIPICDLPTSLRQHNYKGGSCYHASIENVLIGQGEYQTAMDYREKHAYGASTEDIANCLNQHGIKFAYTNDGDIAFLEKALNSRRMIALPYKPGHAINLLGLTPQYAVMLDNNHPQEYEYVPRAEFESNWKHRYGGSAITCVGTPLPPVPHVQLLPEIESLLADADPLRLVPASFGKYLPTIN